MVPPARTACPWWAATEKTKSLSSAAESLTWMSALTLSLNGPLSLDIECASYQPRRDVHCFLILTCVYSPSRSPRILPTLSALRCFPLVPVISVVPCLYLTVIITECPLNASDVPSRVLTITRRALSQHLRAQMSRYVCYLVSFACNAIHGSFCCRYLPAVRGNGSFLPVYRGALHCALFRMFFCAVNARSRPA